LIYADVPLRSFGWVVVAAWLAAQSCVLPNDFSKVGEGGASPQGGGGAGNAGGGAAAGGTGGTAGQAGEGGVGGAQPGTCPPWPGELVSQCDPELLADRDNCCFEGRDCGPDALTNCINGECNAYVLSDPADASDDEGSGITVLGDDLVVGYRDPMDGGIGRIVKVSQTVGGPTQELGQNVLWSPTFLATDGAQVFWLNRFSNDLWAMTAPGTERIVATANGAGDAGFGRIFVRDDQVFFALESGGIYRADVDDMGVAAARIVDTNQEPVGISVFEDVLFFSERISQRILRGSTEGPEDQKLEVLAEGADAGIFPGEIATWGGEVYWVTDFDIRAVEADGDAPRVVVSDAVLGCTTACLTSLQVDDEYVYFIRRDSAAAVGAYYRVSRYSDGTEVPVPLVPEGPEPTSLATTCDRVFAVHFDRNVTAATK
jgi:hypothetical protein